MTHRFGSEEKKTVLGVVFSTFIFILLIRTSGASLDRLVILQNQLLNILFGGSADFLSISLMVQLVLALVFLSLAIAFLSAYGAKKDKYRTGLISGIVSSVVILAVIPSVISLFIAAAVILAFTYTIPISNTYFAELKKWKFFRTGSHAAGKALLIINLVVVLGIFISISANGEHYKEIFKKDITETISAATLGTVKIDSPLVKEQINRRVSELVETSPLFQSYIRWLPLLTAFSIWIFLEFLRGLVFANVTGAFTSVLLRIKKK